jgi:hypothetical protein
MSVVGLKNKMWDALTCNVWLSSDCKRSGERSESLLVLWLEMGAVESV